jgi:hypothetical protein
LKKQKQSFEGSDSASEIVKKSRRIIEKSGIHSPDLSKMIAVKINNRLTVYAKNPGDVERLKRKYSQQLNVNLC